MKRAIQVFDYLCIWLYVKAAYMSQAQLSLLIDLIIALYYVFALGVVSWVVFK